MARSNVSNQAFTGVFLVGLGIIACFNYWWPGIMFVIAVSILVSALIDGKLGENIISIFVLTAIGVSGLWQKLHIHPDFPVWPVVLILLGIGYLVRTFWKRDS